MPVLPWASIDERDAGDTWNILCPGPSLIDQLPSIPRQYPTIAVTKAILSPFFTTGWWCIRSLTLANREMIEAANDRRVRIIAGGDAYDWRKQERWLRYEPKIILPPERGAKLPYFWNGERFRTENPLMNAVRFAYLVGRAKEVHIYGADLSGAGYAYGEDTLQRGPMEWEGKWKVERACLSRVIRAARKDGQCQVRRKSGASGATTSPETTSD